MVHRKGIFGFTYPQFPIQISKLNYQNRTDPEFLKIIFRSQMWYSHHPVFTKKKPHRVITTNLNTTGIIILLDVG